MAMSRSLIERVAKATALTDLVIAKAAINEAVASGYLDSNVNDGGLHVQKLLDDCSEIATDDRMLVVAFLVGAAAGSMEI